MRYFKILLLHFEHIMEHRVRSFVWFLVTAVNPLIFILYWRGVMRQNGNVFPAWNSISITSYFFLMTIIGACLMSHIEDEIAQDDIQEGNLVQYLTKPFPYYIFKFYEEIHYRLLQGGYGIVIVIIISILIGPVITITSNGLNILLFVATAILALFLSYTFKLIIGFVAFWTTDIWSLYFFVDIILTIFAGYIVPIEFLIYPLNKLASIMPFSYIIYYPIVILQGKLATNEIFKVIETQFIWLIIMGLICWIMWKKGIKIFSGVSQ